MFPLKSALLPLTFWMQQKTLPPVYTFPFNEPYHALDAKNSSALSPAEPPNTGMSYSSQIELSVASTSSSLIESAVVNSKQTVLSCGTASCAAFTTDAYFIG